MSGDELKSLRQRVGLTRDDFARLAGVNLTTVDRWESGMSKTPRRLRLRVLLMQLQLKRRELLGETQSWQEWENWLDQHLAGVCNALKMIHFTF